MAIQIRLTDEEKQELQMFMQCRECLGKGAVVNYLTGESKVCQSCAGLGTVIVGVKGGKDDTD